MSDVLLSEPDVRRLCMALISEFQTKRISQGRLSSSLSLESAIARHKGKAVEAIAIDEDTLGIDSLALLDLVMEMTRFFNLQETGIEDYLFVRRSLGEWIELISHHFERVGAEARITFGTSGSSGDAKFIPRSFDELIDEVRELALVVGGVAPGSGEIHLAVSPHHIYGFIWGVLLPKALNRAAKDHHKTSPLALAGKAKNGDVILATPYLWSKFRQFGVELEPGCIGVSSGGPTGEDTFAAAKAIGLRTLLDVYGSTETGGVGLRKSFDEPYELLAHLRCQDSKVFRLGEIDPLELQDALVWVDESKFYTTGRLDKVVQVAGTNVSLGQVRETIASLDAVEDAAVRLDGDRLKAFVVPCTGHDAQIEDDIRRALRSLPAVARPEKIKFGLELPRHENGKLSDW